MYRSKERELEERTEKSSAFQFQLSTYLLLLARSSMGMDSLDIVIIKLIILNCLEETSIRYTVWLLYLDLPTRVFLSLLYSNNK
jgi:hypothetical protein